MIYSLKAPKQKPLLNKFNTLCSVIVLAFCIFIIGSSVYLIIKQQLLEKQSEEANIKNQEVTQEIFDLKNEIKLRKYQISLVDDIKAANNNLKQNIRNIFDLVPDSIVLNEVIMEQKSLLLKGRTPTKDVYNNLLNAPLKSIFSTSKTNFIQLKNGWYNFTSINTFENSEGFNE